MLVLLMQQDAAVAQALQSALESQDIDVVPSNGHPSHMVAERVVPSRLEAAAFPVRFGVVGAPAGEASG